MLADAASSVKAHNTIVAAAAGRVLNSMTPMIESGNNPDSVGGEDYMHEGHFARDYIRTKEIVSGSR